MPGVCRLGDMSTGHGCWPARPNDQGSLDVFVNGLPVHRVGDHWVTHCCTDFPFPCHDGVLAAGSSTCIANGLGVGRIGDPISCGDTVATGSSDCIAG